MVEWLSSWLVEQGAQGSIPGLATLGTVDGSIFMGYQFSWFSWASEKHNKKNFFIMSHCGPHGVRTGPKLHMHN